MACAEANAHAPGRPAVVTTGSMDRTTAQRNQEPKRCTSMPWMGYSGTRIMAHSFKPAAFLISLQVCLLSLYLYIHVQ